MTATAGFVCHKLGFGCTVLDDAGDAVDHEITIPKHLDERSNALQWLSEEVERLVGQAGVAALGIQSAPAAGRLSASRERVECEAAVQIGASRGNVACHRFNREQVRAALEVPKYPGAYDALLKRPDVEARSNKRRREQYLLAQAASKKVS